MLDLLEAASGLSLAFHDKGKKLSIFGEVSITGVRNLTSRVSPDEKELPSLRRGTPSSPALAIELEEIIEDPNQDSMLRLGGTQSVNSFGELNAAFFQEIDIDNLVRIEAEAPGSGVALLFHHIVANFRVHDLNSPGRCPGGRSWARGRESGSQ